MVQLYSEKVRSEFERFLLEWGQYVPADRRAEFAKEMAKLADIAEREAVESFIGMLKSDMERKT